SYGLLDIAEGLAFIIGAPLVGVYGGLAAGAAVGTVLAPGALAATTATSSATAPTGALAPLAKLGLGVTQTATVSTGLPFGVAGGAQLAAMFAAGGTISTSYEALTWQSSFADSLALALTGQNIDDLAEASNLPQSLATVLDTATQPDIRLDANIIAAGARLTGKFGAKTLAGELAGG